VTRPAPIEQADPTLIELPDAMPTVPAIILGRHSDVLAWNPIGHALLLGHLDYACVSVPGRRPNLIELVFLDPNMRALFADWPRKARAVVGNLRLAAGTHPGTLQAAPPADRRPHHHPADPSLDPGSRPNDRDLHGPRRIGRDSGTVQARPHRPPAMMPRSSSSDIDDMTSILEHSTYLPPQRRPSQRTLQGLIVDPQMTGRAGFLVPRSAVAGRVSGLARVLHLDYVTHGIRARSVEVREAVLLGEAAARQ
jgi:hypothetical protein